MQLTGILLDYKPACLPDDADFYSALTLPIARGGLLREIADALARVSCRRLIIVPSFEHGDGYVDRIQSLAGSNRPTIVRPDQRGEQLLEGESSDSLIFVDPRFFPPGGIDFTTMLEAHAEHRGAVFVTGSAGEGDSYAERAVVDASGNVRKIHRLFDRMAWSQCDASFVPACVIPYMLTLQGPQFPLSSTRRRFATRGVPVRDIPCPSPLVPLNRFEDWLQLGCTFDAGSEPYISPQANIHPNARLIGKVVVHDSASVETDATIVGPAFIGAGATVQRDATVAQAIVLDKAIIPTAANVFGRIVAGTNETMQPATTYNVRQPAAMGHTSFRVVEQGRPPIIEKTRFTLATKRVVDFFIAAAGLLLLSPLLACTAILIKLTSRGPVFFTHCREGQNGNVFGCLKFRTMRTDAHEFQAAMAEQNEADGPQFTIRNDPRVTRVGRFLRISNIDELPQLWNVLRGDMSLVGPRPSPFRENQICAPWRYARLSVPPGITGIWQICRHDRHEGDFHQWIYYDTCYVREMSPWLDLRILWYTFWTLGGRRPVPIEKVLRNSKKNTSAAHATAQVT